MQKTRIMTGTQTAMTLCCAYKGPWLMPRIVTITTDKTIDASAMGELTITADNPFINMHPHGFPGVMIAEFTQQLGYILAKEVLKIDGLPFMLELNIKSRYAIQIGDTITATTTLTEVKGRGKRMQFFFESIAKKGDITVMETKFYGMPVPSKC
jgi:predicted thioesterase